MGMTNNALLWTPYLLYLLFRFAHFLLEVPTVRMIEYAVCHQQFDALPSLAELDEAACNTVVVHEQVAKVVGWKICFDAIPGYLHDTLPISAIWVSSLFLLIGGGPFVFAAVTAALVADLVEPSSRTRYLFLLAAVPHFDKLTTPPIATMLMTRNIYLPSIISSGTIILCIVLLQTIKDPEQASKATPDETSTSNEPLLNSTNRADDVLAQPSGPTYQEDTSAPPPNIFHHLKKLVTRLRCNPVLGFCYFAFFSKSNAMASEAFIFQYLSEKFGWPLRETPILRLALSFGAFLTTFVIGPLATSMLVRRGVPTPKIDLGIIHMSLSVLTVSFIVAWRANSSAIFILSMLGAGFGEGLDPALQGLASAVGGTEETGRLFGFIYTYSLLGDMTGGPLMSALMDIGRGARRASDGYCFLASSIIFGTMAVLAYMARAPRGTEEMGCVLTMPTGNAEHRSSANY